MHNNTTKTQKGGKSKTAAVRKGIAAVLSYYNLNVTAKPPLK